MGEQAKACWYCHRGAMALKTDAIGPYWQCPLCGATDIKTPKLGPNPIMGATAFGKNTKKGYQPRPLKKREKI